MPVSSQLSGLASIWSEVIEIISTILLNYPSVLPLGALLCLVITKWYLYHRHHHHYHRHRHGVSSLFIISASHWSLFFCVLWSCDPKYHAIIILINVFSTDFCVNKRLCVHPPVHRPHTPHPALLLRYSQSALCPIWPTDPHLSSPPRPTILGPVLF